MSTDCYTSGFRPKVPQWRFVNIESKEEKEQFKKGREGNLKHT